MAVFSRKQNRLSTKNAGMLLFFMLFLTYTWIHQWPGANQSSRLAFLHAMFNRHEITIDAYETRAGSDKALINGHYYSEKAPGTVLTAIPGFAIARIGMAIRGIKVESGWGWLISDWVSTAFSVDIITAAGGVAMLLWLTRRVGRHAALITTLALFLGAAPFPYATMLFAHAATVGWMCVGLWLLDEPVGKRRSMILAGACAGLAVAGEYTAGIGMLGLLSLSGLKGRSSFGWFCLGLIPPLLLIPLYNGLISGSPFSISYTHGAVYGGVHSQGFFGIMLPNMKKAIFLLFSQSRGLFFWTPFLLLVIPGWFDLKRILSKSESAIFFLVPILQVLAISGFIGLGGSALGPRYLCAAIPFLALPAAHACKTDTKLGTGLAFLSILLTGIGTVTNPMPPVTDDYPLLDIHVPYLLVGRFVPMLPMVIGVQGWLALSPILICICGCIGVLYMYWATSSEEV